jgi:type VI protein secretion system component Hcp
VYLELKMERCILTSRSVALDGNGAGTESLGFEFEKVELKYIHFDLKSGQGRALMKSYDARQNVAA